MEYIVINPDRLSLILLKVTGIVLRGIFLLRKKELDWFYEGGAAAIYPDGMHQISLKSSLNFRV